MDFFYQLLARLQQAPFFRSLPGDLREPPGLWLLAAAAVLLAAAAAWATLRLASKVLFGGRAEKRVDRTVRSSLRRDLAEMKRQGNLKGAGEIYEGLGQTRKALQAYRKGGCHRERAMLLMRLDRRGEAKKVARAGGVWRLYAEICQEDGEHGEAAVAFERDGQVYLAGRCYEQLGRSAAAARCYIAAGMEAQAVALLEGASGAKTAELLDQALRSSLAATGPSGLSLELQKAVRRAVQLWLGEGRPEKAFRLAVDAGQLKLAVPVARDYLEPSAETAELCERAGALLVAADLWQRLGETRRGALQRAAYHRERQEPEAAADAFEAAEEWIDAAEQRALAGDTARAAELFAEGGDLQSAAQLFAQACDTERSQQLLSRAHAQSIEGRFEADDTARLAEDRGLGASPAPPDWPQRPEDVSPDGSTVARPAGGPAQARPEDSESAPESAPLHTLPAGGTAPRYRLLEEIGRGGMGVVFRAEDRVLLRQVAYKRVPESAVGVDFGPEALLAEARAAARLSHPNIVQVFDVGRQDGAFYIVMELAGGSNLESLLQKKRLSLRGVVQVARQVCAALGHAHDRQIIHRDLKPSNLLLSEDTGSIKLSDFGLARIFEAQIGKVSTQPAGTPSYMSPEQIRGEPLSLRTDLYSLGCVMWEMLCHEPVFGTGPPSFHHHLASTPEDPRNRRSDVPGSLAELVLECLAKSPADRPQSAAEIGRRLG
ncbi:MAG: serine/threonine-protein kinase [Acidobacteriota bacterium]